MLQSNVLMAGGGRRSGPPTLGRPGGGPGWSISGRPRAMKASAAPRPLRRRGGAQRVRVPPRPPSLGAAPATVWGPAGDEVGSGPAGRGRRTEGRGGPVRSPDGRDDLPDVRGGARRAHRRLRDL